MALLWYFKGLVPWSDFPSVQGRISRYHNTIPPYLYTRRSQNVSVRNFEFHSKPGIITRSPGSSPEAQGHHSKPRLITRSLGSSLEARAHYSKPGLISRSPGSSLEAWAHHSKPGLILALWKSWAISLMELTIPITSFICNCFNC